MRSLIKNQSKNQHPDTTADDPNVALKQRVYADYAAATPLADKVRDAMWPYFDAAYGANPSAIHQEGQRVSRAITDARQDVATMLGITPTQVTFTSGGTEGNNLAIRGFCTALFEAGRAYQDMHIITTRCEHPATSESVAAMARLGVRVDYVAVDSVGRVDTEALQLLLRPETVLVCVSYINSETGTIEALRRIARTLKNEQLTTEAYSDRPRLFVDAAQAPLWSSCALEPLGADLLALDAGKMQGPKGMGILARGREVVLSPVLYGGGQEAGLRPGTEHVAGIIGVATALRCAQAERAYEARSAATAKRRDYLWQQIAAKIPEAVFNGAIKSQHRVANNVHISLPGINTEFAVVDLDRRGVAASTKSACSSAGGGASTVIYELTADELRARSTLRFTISPEHSDAESDQIVRALRAHIDEMGSAVTNF